MPDALAGFALSRQLLRWMVDNEVMEPPETLEILRALRDLENGHIEAFIEARRMLEELRREMTPI